MDQQPQAVSNNRMRINRHNAFVEALSNGIHLRRTHLCVSVRVRSVEGAGETGVERVAQVGGQLLLLELLEQHIRDERAGVHVEASAQAPRQSSDALQRKLHHHNVRVLQRQQAQ